MVSVAVAFAIGQVVLVTVRGQIRQRHAVMGGQQVDTGQGRAAVMVKVIAGTREPTRQLAPRAVVAQPEGAAGIAKTVIPFMPASGKSPELVAIRPKVPRLGNQLDTGQDRVLCQGRQQAGHRVKIVMKNRVAPQRCGEVKAKPIHTKRLHPPAQAVHDHLYGAGLRQIEAVATTTEVKVLACRVQCVPTGVVQAAPAQGGAKSVTLGAVVEHHIQHHLQSVLVQLVHHVPEFGTVIGKLAAGVSRLRDEISQGVVAPVVAQALLQQMRFGHEQLHRQQTQGGDAQALVMRQHG